MQNVFKYILRTKPQKGNVFFAEMISILNLKKMKKFELMKNILKTLRDEVFAVSSADTVEVSKRRSNCLLNYAKDQRCNFQDKY